MCQTSAGICEPRSLSDFSRFDHTTVVLELLFGESCSRFAAFTNRKARAVIKVAPDA
jgi:hypothetical protein